MFVYVGCPGAENFLIQLHLSHTHVCLFVICDVRIECRSLCTVGISSDEQFGGGYQSLIER
jgi:hypothetical protein